MAMTRETKDKIQYIFGGVVMFLLFSLIALLIFYDIPEANKDVLNIGIGVVLGWGSTIIAYLYGSSRGSADKDELLRNANNKP